MKIEDLEIDVDFTYEIFNENNDINIPSMHIFTMKELKEFNKFLEDIDKAIKLHNPLWISFVDYFKCVILLFNDEFINVKTKNF